MSLVWRKLQRSNKKAAKFKFSADFQELSVQCDEKWQPRQLHIAWVHRRRRYPTRSYRWEPTITDPCRGLIHWPQGTEYLDILTTMYRDSKSNEWEDKVERSALVQITHAFTSAMDVRCRGNDGQTEDSTNRLSDVEPQTLCTRSARRADGG